MKKVMSSPQKKDSQKIKEAVNTVKFMNHRIKQELKETKTPKLS